MGGFEHGKEAMTAYTFSSVLNFGFSSVKGEGDGISLRGGELRFNY